MSISLADYAKNSAADPAHAYRLDNDASAWANRGVGFPVTDIRVDRVKWARDWDKGIEKLAKPAQVVFLRTAMIRYLPHVYNRITPSDYDSLQKCQEMAEHNHSVCSTSIRDAIHDSSLDRYNPKDWFMLVSTEKRYEILCDALEKTCWRNILGQDARMLCHEIVGTTLLKRRGMELFAFFDRYVEMAFSVKQDSLNRNCMIENDWWSCALQFGAHPPLPNENATWLYKFFTCARQDFIDHFAYNAMLDVAVAWNADMDKSLTSVPRLILNVDRQGMRDIVSAKKASKGKDMLICEHCERSPEEADNHVRFLVCAVCKRNLNFECYYCSRECQKSNWPQHKRHCGKEKVSKSRSLGRPEYKRSLQLLLQLKMQSNDEDTDYFIFKFGSECYNATIPFQVSFQRNKGKKALFREKRALAAMDADRAGLDILAKCLVDALADDQVSSTIEKEHIIQQLTAEYEVDVGARLAALEAALEVEGEEKRYRGMCIFDAIIPEVFNKMLDEDERLDGANEVGTPDGQN